MKLGNATARQIRSEREFGPEWPRIGRRNVPGAGLVRPGSISADHMGSQMVWGRLLQS